MFPVFALHWLQRLHRGKVASKSAITFTFFVFHFHFPQFLLFQVGPAQWPLTCSPPQTHPITWGNYESSYLSFFFQFNVVCEVFRFSIIRKGKVNEEVKLSNCDWKEISGNKIYPGVTSFFRCNWKKYCHLVKKYRNNFDKILKQDIVCVCWFKWETMDQQP